MEEGSPAEKAGLKAGDVVLEYNGERVEGMEQFGRLRSGDARGTRSETVDQPQRRDPNVLPPPSRRAS